jgi:protein O-GlcNAc transferase
MIPKMMTLQQSFELAVRHQSAGQLAEAEQLFRQILAQNPNHADALHRLGVIAFDLKNYDAAIGLIERAIALLPSRASFYSNLGNVFKARGDLKKAVVFYQSAIKLKPDFFEAYYNLAIVLRDQGELDQAISAYRKSIQLRPDSAEVHNNLGLALKDQRQLEQASAEFRKAIQLNADFAMAHSNLGCVLTEQGTLDESIAALRRAIQLKPDYAEAHYNLGIALMDKGELDGAIETYRTAIKMNPAYAQAYNNLGIALAEKGRLDEALTAYRTAIQLQPRYAEAHSNLGSALTEKGQSDEAVAAYQNSIQLNPQNSQAQNNLGLALSKRGELDGALTAYQAALKVNHSYGDAYSNLGNVFKDQGQLDQAIEAYRKALELHPDNIKAHSNLIFALHFHPDYGPNAITAEARRWYQQHAEPLKNTIYSCSNDRAPERRLRIGYVSPDFRKHPVGRFMLPLLEHHDHTLFEIFCYSDARRPDELTAQLRSHADTWRDTAGLSHPQLAEIIRQDQIDILVDLVMHTEGSRLLVFALKPAPLQITWLAYPGITGLETIDYRITNPLMDPPDPSDESHFEKPLRLPQTYWCYQPPANTPQVNALPALATGQLTFGCLNNLAKVTAVTLSAWCAVLRGIPSSRLILHAKEGNFRQNLQDLFVREGVDPARVELIGKVSELQYFQTYHRIDIALDPFPYCGGTTTCDALWMGVPVVTLSGDTPVSRAGLSILTNVGLPQLVAKTTDEYVRIATGLAADLPQLAALRSQMRHRMGQSPLMDAPRFAQNMEEAYRNMWRGWCDEHQR